jgi:hypothetical protein
MESEMCQRDLLVDHRSSAPIREPPTGARYNLYACMHACIDHTRIRRLGVTSPERALDQPALQSCLPAAPHIQYCCNAHACRSVRVLQ